MKVKKLIALLSKCDQEAEVSLECWENIEPKIVAEYTFENGKEVKIADDLTYVDGDLEDCQMKFKKRIIR